MLEQFKKYVDGFKLCDAVKYKYAHSIVVMELCKEIGRTLNLNEEQLKICETIGLLHDYARFPQWDKFKSFDDLKTFDHGDEAVKILFEQNEIKKYNLEDKNYELVETAIKYHNKYEIGKVDNETLIFCQIIRDADKLDIIRNFTKGLFNNTNDDFIHDEVKEQFFKHKSVKKIQNSTNNDKLVIMLALIYDLNFNYSFEYLLKNNIIENIKKQVNINVFDIYFKEIEKYTVEKVKEKKYVR